jgi:DNA-binding NtrC family response regulator
MANKPDRNKKDIPEELIDAEARVEMEHVRKKSIVIIDDQQEILDALKTYLNVPGKYFVNTFADEFKALESIKDEAPDLIICDFWLESLNGVKVKDFLKNIELFEGPVLLISSFGRDKIEQELKGQKIDMHYMQKPIDKKRLLHFVEESIG